MDQLGEFAILLGAFVTVGVVIVALIASLVRTDIKAAGALKEAIEAKEDCKEFAAEAKIDRQRLENKQDERFEKRDDRIGDLEKELSAGLRSLGMKFEADVGGMRRDITELSKEVHTLIGAVSGGPKEH